MGSKREHLLFDGSVSGLHMGGITLRLILLVALLFIFGCASSPHPYVQTLPSVSESKDLVIETKGNITRVYRKEKSQ